MKCDPHVAAAVRSLVDWTKLAIDDVQVRLETAALARQRRTRSMERRVDGPYCRTDTVGRLKIQTWPVRFDG